MTNAPEESKRKLHLPTHTRSRPPRPVATRQLLLRLLRPPLLLLSPERFITLTPLGNPQGRKETASSATLIPSPGRTHEGRHRRPRFPLRRQAPLQALGTRRPPPPRPLVDAHRHRHPQALRSPSLRRPRRPRPRRPRRPGDGGAAEGGAAHVGRLRPPPRQQQRQQPAAQLLAGGLRGGLRGTRRRGPRGQGRRRGRNRQDLHEDGGSPPLPTVSQERRI